MEDPRLLESTVASPVLPVAPVCVDQTLPEIQTHGLQADITSLKECNMFMSGFSGCAEEAIRFLTEDEGLSFNHPLVMGLYEHLSDQQKFIYLEYLLRSSTQLIDGVSPSCGSADIQSAPIIGECVPQTEQNTSDTVLNTPAIKCSEQVDDVVSDDHESIAEQKERLATEIAEELFRLLQSDFYSEDELVDEGFEDSFEP